MNAIEWRMYRGISTLTTLITEAALAVEKALLVKDNTSELERILDDLLYKGIAEARDLRPHLLTYAEAVFEGVQHPAPVDAAPGPDQHGAPSAPSVPRLRGLNAWIRTR
jgi:hypothetical protein